jgi:hypothetical protein
MQAWGIMMSTFEDPLRPRGALRETRNMRRAVTISGNVGQKPAKQPPRFPRLLPGEALAALEKLFWTEPIFEVSVPEDGEAMIFTYRIATPSEVRNRYPGVHDLFFGDGRYLWAKRLDQAYRESKSGDKDFHQLIGYFLRRTLHRALEIWVSESWQLSRADRPKELEEFGKKGTIKRTQPDPRLAFWIAKRVMELEPIVIHLRKTFGRRHEPVSDQELSAEIRKHLPPQHLQRALARIFVKDTHIPLREVLTRKRLNTSRIVQALVECEMEDLHLSLGYISWKKHVTVGKEILLALDTSTKS